MPRAIGAAVITRILIVDDEEPILFALRDYFTNLSCVVHCAQEMEEAEALLTANEYDVVIADLRLTGIHGTEGLELVTFVRGRSSARIILLTAYGSAEIERLAYERGADAFLHKPTPFSYIASLVGDLLARQAKGDSR